MTNYTQAKRRLELDMHIPDWDPAFLSRYSPQEYARLVEKAGAEAALIYCKSHMGLAYWPTPVGGVHPVARERDLVGELLTELRSRNIGVAAYHSVVFDNWAAHAHRDWRTEVIDLGHTQDHEDNERYGHLCVNETAYRDYERTQIQSLIQRYDFDALVLDMAFSPGACGCRRCAQRFRDEVGGDLPDAVDWTDPRWCAYQAARERWVHEFFLDLKAAVRQVRPDLPITHNLAPGLIGWVWAQNSDGAADDSFAAGDLYGGLDEEVLVLALMRAVRPDALNEFMVSRTLDLKRHASTKSVEWMRTQAMVAMAHATAFLFIDAIDPSGALNEAVYERIGGIFETMSAYDGVFGGEPVANVGLYYSDASRVEPFPRDAGLFHVRQLSPHQEAITGAARALRRAHIPFGVLTKGTLASSLAAYEVVVVADAPRLSPGECELLRGFVAAGGRLYASGLTSLLDTETGVHKEFALADVFGVRFDGLERGREIYASPRHPTLVAAFGVDHFLGEVPGDSGTPRVRVDAAADVLAGLTLPYGYPARGDLDGGKFASIHSSPPWEEVPGAATVTLHHYGNGTCVYSAIPLEAGRNEKHERAFVGLLRDCLGLKPAVVVTAKPDMLVTVLQQRDPARLVVIAVDCDLGHEGFDSEVRIALTGSVEDMEVHDGLDGEPILGEADQGSVHFTLTPRQPVSIAVIAFANGASSAHTEKGPTS